MYRGVLRYNYAQLLGHNESYVIVDVIQELLYTLYDEKRIELGIGGYGF